MKYNSNFEELNVQEQDEINGGGLPFLVKAGLTALGWAAGYIGLDKILN